jgi:hypothetical protein
MILFILVGCGVKSKPNSPPEKAVQSYINTFLDKKIIPPETAK